MFSGTDMDLSHKSHIYNDENDDKDDKDYNVQQVNKSAVKREHLSSWDSHLFCVCVCIIYSFRSPKLSRFNQQLWLAARILIENKDREIFTKVCISFI
jgi:hypothetical protein